MINFVTENILIQQIGAIKLNRIGMTNYFIDKIIDRIKLDPV